MRFQLLGDFKVLVDGQDVTPSAPKIVQILALLAIRNNEIVPIQALVDELWGERPPVRAARTVHTYIYEARRLLTSPNPNGFSLPLMTRANGYTLQAQHAEVDLNLFDELVAEGRKNLSAGYPREARELLSKALAMWHGPALANVSCGEFLASRAARLEEDRLRALEMRIEADFQLDLHHELIGELKSLTADHPFHEGLHEKLMLALYYSGRRNESLDVYQTLRRRLVDDMGLEPNSRLQRTQQNVISGDLALDAAAGDPRASVSAYSTGSGTRSLLLSERADRSGSGAGLAYPRRPDTCGGRRTAAFHLGKGTDASTRRLTVAQAVVEFLAAQYSERDGQRRRLVPGCFGIVGHGNVANLGEVSSRAGGGPGQPAVNDRPARHGGGRMRFYPVRGEQAMAYAAAAYSRATNRLQTLACTSSIEPGGTNMVTAAAAATINRVPLLLLPSEIFAGRRPVSVPQQLEGGTYSDISVNDCFRPVARYWDRINRPEQLVTSLPAAMRVLTDPAETGAVVLSLPQDVRAQVYDFPAELFAERVWRMPRTVPDPAALSEAARVIAGARRPLIVAGGGVIHSEATGALRAFVDATGIPVAETHVGKGALAYGHPLALGGIGATGSRAANEVARESDVVIGLGTRWNAFTTTSHAVFANPDVRFVNVNVTSFDAGEYAGVPVVADARAALEALRDALEGYRVESGYRRSTEAKVRAWDEEVDRLLRLGNHPLPAQSEVIGAVNEAAGERGVVVCASGSLPGDLHKLWRPRVPGQYYVEFGSSWTGHEVAGGLGVKLAVPDRDVFVLVGDGSWPMLAQEIVTSVQERVPFVVVLVDNSGYASLGGLTTALGSGGIDARCGNGAETGRADGAQLPVDLAANAASLGARVLTASTVGELATALQRARAADVTTVVHVRTDPDVAVPSYAAAWELPIAEVSA